MIIEVSPNERLIAQQVAVWLNIPISVFNIEVAEGLWDGTFVLQGDDKRFIAHLVEKRQGELAEKSAAIMQQRRREETMLPGKRKAPRRLGASVS